ncbi:MAG: NAD(+)/NADH kinase [Armatimonadetes bacterium]|nr:NAD(+)/NADH kinase [Armatimonadota bacterium]
MRFHLLVNLYRADAIEAAKIAAASLIDRGVQVFADELSAKLVGIPTATNEDFGNCDLVISFGGDGTLLNAAQRCGERHTPILGVHYGKFGFVTQCQPSELGAALSMFVDGNSTLEERMMVQATLVRSGETIAEFHALNEAVVQRAATTRMLEFEIFVDNQFLTQYPADGIIVSTPTGSTAYNLSAGGPIVDPKLEVILLSAITPHTLSARPLVFGSNSTIEIRVETRGDAILSCDGHDRVEMFSGDRVIVTKSDRTIRLVQVDDQDFLNKVTNLLLGGGSST